MSKGKYYPPIHAQEQFHCPHCNVYAKQLWAHVHARQLHGSSSSIFSCVDFNEYLDEEWTISKCEHCGEKIIWLGDIIVYPKKIIVSLPNEDLSQEIQNDYLEAANIFNDSPRASAALLRLALQKLCIQLGGDGKNINNDIKELVKNGLNPLVQKSLDSLRITGNNAVHPGEINLDEESERVLRLFELINFIAQKMITEPKEIEGFYDKLPQNAKDAILDRDK